MMDRVSTDAFLAKVVSEGEAGLWTVQPLIQELDGSLHPEISAKTRDGLTPTIGDTVLITTMRNNLDFSVIGRFYLASASNSVIIGIMKTIADPSYILTGNYNFIGDSLFTGNVVIDGNLEVSGDVDITGSLTIGGIPFENHMHLPGTYSNSGGPVVGTSGGVV